MAGRDPDRGGGGQAAHVESFLDDDAGAEEADAGHDALGHARGIEPRFARERTQWSSYTVTSMSTARCQAHQHVRAQARGASVKRALVTDAGARQQCGDQSQQHLELFMVDHVQENDLGKLSSPMRR